MKTRIVLIALLFAFMASTAMARVPRKNPSEFDKGTTCYDKQQYQQAIEWMDQVLAQNPDNGFALAYKGSSLRYLDRLDEAAAALDRAATLIDDVNTAFRAWTNSERFYAHIYNGDTIAAMQAINEAIRDDGKNALYWENRAVIKSALGQFDESIADYDQAVALAPNDTDLKAKRQRVIDYQERYQAAVDGIGVDYYDMRDTTATDEVVLPQFPGGDEALKAYLNRKTGWSDTKPPVSVIVEVTIDEKGKVTDATIFNGYSKKLDKKALEICRELPQFAPATHHGEPMECKMQIRIRFVDPNY